MTVEWRGKRPQSALSLAERLSTSEHYSFSLQKVAQARRVSEKVSKGSQSASRVRHVGLPLRCHSLA